MTTSSKLDWQNQHISDTEPVAAGTLIIEIRDDCETYCAILPAGITAEQAIDDFAGSYDHNGETGSVPCWWTLYRASDETANWTDDEIDGGSFEAIA